MAASGSKHAAGTTMTIAAAVTEVLSVTGPGMKRETIDVTHLGSDSTAREFIAGLIDSGEVTVELQFIKTIATALIALLVAATPTASACTIVLGGSLGTLGFNAFVTGYDPKVVVGEKVTATVSLRTTGLVTLT